MMVFLGLTATPGVAAAVPVVATDIVPVHSIAARVMQGIGTPGLVVAPGASPHGYALRPSEARLLQDADIVVWTGSDLTPWLADPIDSLAAGATLVTLQDVPGVTLLPIRSGGGFEPEADAHGDGGDHDEDGHGHGHEHGGHDGHLWLDPVNAVAAAQAIAEALATADPANADAYEANADDFTAETEAQARAIAERLAPLRGRPFIVFHDAYQYFEQAFDFPAVGSIALQDGVAPGAARVAEIRDRVRDGAVVCAFAEPEFEPRLLATVIEGTTVRTGVIDGLGAALPPGPGLYPALLDGIAGGLEDCLGQ